MVDRRWGIARPPRTGIRPAFARKCRSGFSLTFPRPSRRETRFMRKMRQALAGRSQAVTLRKPVWGGNA